MPITPDEVASLHQAIIPEFVFDAFDYLIAKNWGGKVSIVRQDDVVAYIMDSGFGGTRKEIFGSKWLNVEPAYREAGWDVKYNRPSYTESYPAFFEFRCA
jgi:hypothetical protein